MIFTEKTRWWSKNGGLWEIVRVENHTVICKLIEGTVPGYTSVPGEDEFGFTLGGLFIGHEEEATYGCHLAAPVTARAKSQEPSTEGRDKLALMTMLLAVAPAFGHIAFTNPKSAADAAVKYAQALMDRVEL